jgi:hypothetical protein
LHWSYPHKLQLIKTGKDTTGYQYQSIARQFLSD